MPIAFSVVSVSVQEREDAYHDNGEDEANAHRYPPRGSTRHLFRSVVDAVCQEDPKGDEQLVAANESAANLLWRCFCLIHRCEHR